MESSAYFPDNDIDHAHRLGFMYKMLYYYVVYYTYICAIYYELSLPFDVMECYGWPSVGPLGSDKVVCHRRLQLSSPKHLNVLVKLLPTFTWEAKLSTSIKFIILTFHLIS
jgi:hypothetical protein